MLEDLIIENFAIIEKIELQFETGMSVLTGETGAGKSIIIDALSMLTGGRASSEMVRHGSKRPPYKLSSACQKMNSFINY